MYLSVLLLGLAGPGSASALPYTFTTIDEDVHTNPLQVNARNFFYAPTINEAGTVAYLAGHLAGGSSVRTGLLTGNGGPPTLLCRLTINPLTAFPSVD